MENLTESLIRIFQRDLDQLEKELRLYPDEASVWTIRRDIKNPGGNLCLHICGNLRTYIGRMLGGTGYVRNRDLEFSAKNVPVEELCDAIKETREVVTTTLQRLQPGDLEKPYPTEELGYPMTTGFFLIHLASHLNYHRGQVNYHRRLIANI
jgi:uncharacterized damage-inducible protein DinB